MAVWVPLKGAEEYAVKSIMMFIQSLGIPKGVIQSWSAGQTPLNSKGSDGMVERLHLELQSMFRTIRDRFLIDQKDQKTACQRHYQRLYQRPLVQFGECVLWKDPHKQRFKYEANLGYGIYLGRAMDSEEHLVGCRTAAFNGRSC
eukprot:2718588-Amphidinium_carterae.3